MLPEQSVAVSCGQLRSVAVSCGQLSVVLNRRSCCSPGLTRRPVSQTSRSAPYDDASCAVSCGQLRSVVVSCGQLSVVLNRRSCCSARCWPRPARRPVSQTSRSAPYDDASCAVSCGQLRSDAVSCSQLSVVLNRRSCCLAPCWPRPARRPVSQTSRSAPYDDASCAVSCGQLRSVAVSCGQLRSVAVSPVRRWVLLDAS